MFQTVRGVNHAGQLGSVSYRARNGPEELARASLIMKFSAVKKVLKVQKCAERETKESDTRGMADREDERFKRIINRDDVLAPRKSRGD